MTDLGPNRKEIEAELSAEEVAHEHEHVLEHYAEGARLKGFRAGKAPKDMVKQIYQHEIRHALIDHLVPKVLEEILIGRAIRPVGSPVIEDLTLEEGTPLRFKAVVEVWPDFELPAYRKVRTARRGADVPEADVDKTLEDLRRKSAEYDPIEDRAVAAGDYVVIELQGTRPADAPQEARGEEPSSWSGAPATTRPWTTTSAGMAAGESKVFRTTYPEDAPVRALAGKEIEYALKVQSIKAERLPELNDEFAKTLGEFETFGGSAGQDPFRAREVARSAGPARRFRGHPPSAGRADLDRAADRGGR